MGSMAPGEKRPSRIREGVRWGMFWVGMALIGAVAIPAGILCAGIYKGVNFLMEKIEA